jgi:hypothetical protein
MRLAASSCSPCLPVRGRLRRRQPDPPVEPRVGGDGSEGTARAPEAADGSLSLWIDGTLRCTLAGIENGAGGIDLVRLGAVSVKSGAKGALHWDKFVSRRLTYIGP